MEKFIYVFDKKTYERMLAEGFTYICKSNLRQE